MKQSIHVRSEQPQLQSNGRHATRVTSPRFFNDNSPAGLAQRKNIQMMTSSPQVVAQRAQMEKIQNSPLMQKQREQIAVITNANAQNKNNIQRQSKTAETPPVNHTGLPDHLKTGIESLSGLSMNDVKVHYNSDKPAQLQALAYTQGNDIHVAPGQVHHLPHEAWHVVQQRQGRVAPTMQARGQAINDDHGLEQEADTMGAKAKQLQVAPSTTIEEKSNGTTQQKVVQRKWVSLLENGSLNTEQRQLVNTIYQESPIKAYIQMLKFLGDTEKLNYISQVDWSEASISAVNKAISGTIEDLGYFSTSYLFTRIEDVVVFFIPEIEHGEEHNIEVTAEVDESDHGPMTGGAPEEIIDWDELEPEGMSRLSKAKDMFGTPVLFNLFLNLVQYHCKKAGVGLPDQLDKRYLLWLKSGVFTRSQFKQLLGITPLSGDDTKQIIQMARTPNTYSFNGDYTGASNGFNYDNVIYYRDGYGSIDFTKNPKSIVANYNKAEGAKIKSASIQWVNPQDSSSEIQLSNDLKDKTKGVMPSGTKVTLRTATRPQHFAIADMLFPNSRTGTWTWHHLTSKYKMVLVDMTVHAKQGHNGGVYIW